MIPRIPPYLHHNRNISELFWLLSLVDKNGAWSTEALHHLHIPNINDRTLQIIQTGITTPDSTADADTLYADV